MADCRKGEDNEEYFRIISARAAVKKKSMKINGTVENLRVNDKKAVCFYKISIFQTRCC